MIFSYDLTTDIGKVRLEIGDTSDVSGKGVKPDGTYLRDDEIQILLTREGTVGRASAAACEVLARMYARFVNITVGPRSEQLSQASAAYAAQAKELRAQYGGGGARRAVAGGIIKLDGFNSDDTASDSVTLAGSEYSPTSVTVYLDY
jgi:hypothetical protein